MKKICGFILILVVLLMGYAVLKTWLHVAPENTMADVTITATPDSFQQKVREGEICYSLSKEDCLHIFTGLYDLYEKSFEYTTGSSTVEATGSFIYWPREGEYGYNSMPWHVENFHVRCDTTKDVCKYTVVKRLTRTASKFNMSTKTFDLYPNYYAMDTGPDINFRIIKKDADLILGEYGPSTQECGIQRLMVNLKTKEVIRLNSSACESKDFLTDSQENAA